MNLSGSLSAGGNMCSFAAGMMGLTALQGVQQYRAQKQQTRAEVAMYNAQADAAEQNARIEAARRSQIADQYSDKQRQLDQRKRLILGQHAAEGGASGLTGGSITDSDAAAIDQYNEDSLNLLGNQRNDTWSSWNQEVNYRNSANANRTAAYNARQQGKLALMGTLLGTATSMAGAWNKYKGASKEPSTLDGNPTDFYNTDYASPYDMDYADQNIGASRFDKTTGWKGKYTNASFSIPRTPGSYNLIGNVEERTKNMMTFNPKSSLWTKWRKWNK